MPRLVRRQSLRDRILSWLNPLDLALDLFTYIESYDWDGVQSTTSTPLGIALNVLLFLARVNSSDGAYHGYEDVLIKSTSGRSYGGGWGSGNKLGYFLRYFSWFLAGISFLNAAMCFMKKKKYRMFESNIEIEPSTPNARRVPVDSSPSAIGLTSLLSPSKNRHREYTSTTDVWEVSVWDPTAISLKIFSLFSPVHCMIYFLMFPMASNYLLPSPRSATTTYLTAFAIQALLSLQIGWLTSAFTQQIKDRAVVQKEVLREYDSKFVHPRLNMLKRDVAVQTQDDHFEASVEVYTPQFNRQGFVTHPNPNYSEFTKNCAYSATSGFAATPQIENQLRREQSQQYSSGRFRFKQEDQEEETPIKAAWSAKPRRFGTNRSSGVETSGVDNSSADQEKDRERQKQQRERIKRGSDAFSTIYPDLEDDADEHATSNPAALRANNIILNTPALQPKRRLDDHVFSPAPRTQDRAIGRDIGTPRRPTFIGGGINANNVGMNGLVNMAVENSRSLSPSKASSPLKSRARTSSYGASLGKGVFGTPKR